MRAALLRGREHETLGAVDAEAEGPAALAISRGGSEKRYAHLDPNEDAAAFALGAGGWLAAVADGHRGFEAAEAALEHLLEHPAPQWTAPEGVGRESWRRHALAALCDANAQVRLERRDAEWGARTTLALALVLPERDALGWASIGDSHCYRVDAERALDLAEGGPATSSPSFLGHAEESPESLAKKCRIGWEALGHARAVVLATDGLSETGVGVEDPARAVTEAVEGAGAAPAERRALETARALAERAVAAQRRQRAGDNVAVAVLWLGGSDGA